VENRIPHVYVNAVGQEGRLRFCGGSTVADMTGRAVAALSGYQPAVRLVTVPLRPDPADPRPDYLAERRVEVPARVVSPTHRI
jgi:predicted amidohydrolase